MGLIVETPRMVIRTLSMDDVPALREIIGDPEVMKYSVRGVGDDAAAVRFVEWCQTCYREHGVGPWALVERASSSLVGFCGVGPERVGEGLEFNLGYRLARRFWGRGLATEAAVGALTYAFGTKGCESVVVIVEPEHKASLRVAEKVGFRAFQVKEFHGKTVRLYRMGRDEWFKAGARSAT